MVREPKYPPMDGLADEILEHWLQHRPKLARQLEQEGELLRAVQEASERTRKAFSELVESGLESQSAWEAVREEWAFLREEQ